MCVASCDKSKCKAMLEVSVEDVHKEVCLGLMLTHDGGRHIEASRYAIEQDTLFILLHRSQGCASS